MCRTKVEQCMPSICLLKGETWWSRMFSCLSFPSPNVLNMCIQERQHLPSPLLSLPLSPRTPLHVNTTNPQVRFKWQFSCVRISVDLFSCIKWSVWYLSRFVIHLLLCNKCIHMFHDKTSYIRVGMYTVMSDLLNVAAALFYMDYLLSDKLKLCFACNINSWSSFCTEPINNSPKGLVVDWLKSGTV